MMSAFNRAQRQLDMVEQAIHSGDLLQAADAVAQLRPLLVSDRLEELIALRSRVDDLTLSVKHTKGRMAKHISQQKRRHSAVNKYLATRNLTPNSLSAPEV